MRRRRRADRPRRSRHRPAARRLRRRARSSPSDDCVPADPDETLDQGVAGQAVVTGRPFWTGDYVADPRFPHLPGVDRYIEASGIRSVMAVPLIDETGPFGALLVSSGRPDAWTEADAGLLQAIADQAAITIRTTRLIDALDRSRDGARPAGRRRAGACARSPPGSPSCASRARSSSDVVEPGRPARRRRRRHPRPARPGDRQPPLGVRRRPVRRCSAPRNGRSLWISVGVGATGTAVAEDRVVVADDDLAAQFPPSPESTEFYERTGFHSMIAAPITGDAGPLGVIEVYSKRRARSARPTRASSARSPARPPSPSPTPGSSRSWPARATSSPARPTPSGRCARSPAGSARRTTRTRSSRRSSMRRSGCSARPAR